MVPCLFLAAAEGYLEARGTNVIDPVWTSSDVLNPDQRNAFELSSQTGTGFEHNIRDSTQTNKLKKGETNS